jgi:hypothetical protein
MKLAIVAYPTLDEVDRQWIESFRTKYDPQASRLGVYFTLVFPVDAAPGELEPDRELAARTIQPIAFELWSTHVVRDVVGSDALIFLVPSVGGPQIEALHDRLYAGVLRPHLRSEIQFVPHMTVGAASDLQLRRGWRKNWTSALEAYAAWWPRWTWSTSALTAWDRSRPTRSERRSNEVANIGLESSRLLSRAIMSPWRAAQAGRYSDLAESIYLEIIRSERDSTCRGFPGYRVRIGSSSSVSIATSPCTSTYVGTDSTPSSGWRRWHWRGTMGLAHVS